MSNSSTICVDANIIIRYLLNPDDTPIQNLWKTWIAKETQLVAPALLFFEVTNGLYKYQKNKAVSPEIIRKTLELSLDLPINLVNETNLHLRAQEIATQYDLPAAYDAHYLALAEWLDIDLWTADMRLINTLKPFKLKWVKGFVSVEWEES
jgi:predicted nucleic acid-binding protein